MDREYYIFLTTTSGLYRYDINDVISGGAVPRDPGDRLPAQGPRHDQYHRREGQRQPGHRSGAECRGAAGLSPSHFKAEADTDRSRYILRVEFVGRTEPPQQLAFLAEVDRYLKQVNIEYKAKRDSSRLGAPVLHVMREGWYERGRREQAASGKRVFQAKTEVLSRVKAETGVVRPEIENIVELDR